MVLPPGPSWSWPTATYRYINRPYELFEACHRAFGDTFTLRLWQPRQLVCVSHPDTVKAVFTHLARKLVAGDPNSYLRPFLGDNSVLILDGGEHARQRRLISPAFHGDRMRMFGDLMRESAYAALARWQVGTKVTVRNEMQAITLRVVVESVFGKAMGRRTPEIIEIVREFLRIPTLLTFLPFLRVDLGPWSSWGRFLGCRARLDRLLFDEIARRRAAPHGEAGDVMDMLLAAVDEEGQPMTAQEIRDELLTLLLAGHETTATSLAWAFATLLQAPQVLAKLREELASVIGDGPVTIDALPKLAYLEATIKESLRINNLFSVVIREAIEPVEVEGYELPAGTGVGACNVLTHQRPDLYPEPRTFRPERWLGEPLHPFAWYPFGGAPRRCLGMNFALFEMKVLLASILPNVHMALLPEQDLRPRRMALTLAPSSGVQVRIQDVRRPQMSLSTA